MTAISWEELLKQRVEIPQIRNSAHMLKIMREVKEKFPAAEIVESGRSQWKLAADGKDLSNSHNSHYACWTEVRKLMFLAGQ